MAAIGGEDISRIVRLVWVMEVDGLIGCCERVAEGVNGVIKLNKRKEEKMTSLRRHAVFLVCFSGKVIILRVLDSREYLGL